MKGFGDLKLSFLDSASGEKRVKHELSVSSVSGGVTSVGGPSSFIPLGGISLKAIQSSTPKKKKLGKEVAKESMNPRLKVTMEKLTGSFYGERYEKDVLIGTNRLLEQVISSLGEDFALQTAMFCYENNKMKNDLDKLREENQKLLKLSSSLEVEKLDLSSKMCSLGG
ncbi:hypothetical protein LWI28_023873 [Acer negundo]|uniref:Uncharacterized protein n=1 Tax=Acer negundo TaxID=4023 RepID=A0AAD5ISV7_ACENE|nr:hypothetical protein LWI28_023873 [Acer negundo]